MTNSLPVNISDLKLPTMRAQITHYFRRRTSSSQQLAAKVRVAYARAIICTRVDRGIQGLKELSPEFMRNLGIADGFVWGTTPYGINYWKRFDIPVEHLDRDLKEKIKTGKF